MEPFSHDHLPGVADLLRRALLPEDAAEAVDIVEVLRPRYDGFRRTTGWVQTDGGQVVGVAFAAVNNADPHVGHLDLVAVDPDRRRRGLGARLLRQAEDELRDFGCTIVRVAGNPPDYAFPGIDVRYTPAICLVTRAGYAHDRTAWNMTADLDPAALDTAADEARLGAIGVQVRRADADDIARLRPGHSGRVRRALGGRDHHRASGTPRAARRAAGRLRGLGLHPAELVRPDGYAARRQGSGHRIGAAQALPARSVEGWVPPRPDRLGRPGAVLRARRWSANRARLLPLLERAVARPSFVQTEHSRRNGPAG